MRPVVLATPVAPSVAPVNNTMARGPMDNRMTEVSSGCYYQRDTPCCFAGYMYMYFNQLLLSRNLEVPTAVADSLFEKKRRRTLSSDQPTSPSSVHL